MLRGKWSAESLTAPKPSDGHALPSGQYHWSGVMCLVGAAYFGTVAYLPAIAGAALGPLAPLATVALVALMLFGALPVYRRIAHKSPHGGGAIALVERLLPGHAGRALVLILLCFAAAAFTLLTTIAAADAAEHLLHNPWFAAAPAALQNQTVLAISFLALVGAVFLRRPRALVACSVVIVCLFLLVNLIVIASGLWHLTTHPALSVGWYDNVAAGRLYVGDSAAVGGGPGALALLCLEWMPTLAIGLCGLEIGLAMMPLVRGDADDKPTKPAGRIRNAQRLLTAAALIVSLLLVGSSVIAATVIPPEALQPSGPAANRALAFIAHGGVQPPINQLFGPAFGTIYDVSTIATLWLAAAGAMGVLLNWAPRFLPKYGVPPRWASAAAMLALFLTGVNLLVTWVSDADIEAQTGAFAVAALVLVCNNCLAVTLIDWHRRRGAWYARVSWRYAAVMLVFLGMALALIIQRPECLAVVVLLIAVAFASSMVSLHKVQSARRAE
jgi:amino acid transporter